MPWAHRSFGLHPASPRPASPRPAQPGSVPPNPAPPRSTPPVGYPDFGFPPFALNPQNGKQPSWSLLSCRACPGKKPFAQSTQGGNEAPQSPLIDRRRIADHNASLPPLELMCFLCLRRNVQDCCLQLFGSRKKRSDGLRANQGSTRRMSARRDVQHGCLWQFGGRGERSCGRRANGDPACGMSGFLIRLVKWTAASWSALHQRSVRGSSAATCALQFLLWLD